MNRFLIVIVFILCVPIVLVACSALQPEEPSLGSISYNGPTQKAIAVGEFLPGTGIQFIGATEERGAELTIDGQHTFKHTADRVQWNGSPLNGVSLELELRVLWFNEENLRLGGTARIVIQDIAPQTLQDLPETPIQFKMPAAYIVEVGEMIPGTQLRVEGITEEGLARISGWPGKDDPYSLADAVQWFGSLRPGLVTDYNLRLVQIGEESVSLAGFVDVYITP